MDNVRKLSREDRNYFSSERAKATKDKNTDASVPVGDRAEKGGHQRAEDAGEDGEVECKFGGEGLDLGDAALWVVGVREDEGASGSVVE